MKDFFDIVVLARTFDFDGDWLARAMRATFDRRGTALPDGRYGEAGTAERQLLLHHDDSYFSPS